MKLLNLDQLTWDSSDAIYFFVSVAALWLGSDKRLNKNLPLGLWFEMHVFLLLLQQTAWDRISLRTYPSFAASCSARTEISTSETHLSEWPFVYGLKMI